MDLISRKAAIEALGECPENWTDSPEEIEAVNSWCFAADVINSAPSVPAVPLDQLCEFLVDTLHTPAPCFNNEEICPHMDFGYCRLPDDPDVKKCWKKILTKWMEEQDAAD